MFAQSIVHRFMVQCIIFLLLFDLIRNTDVNGIELTRKQKKRTFVKQNNKHLKISNLLSSSTNQPSEFISEPTRESNLELSTHLSKRSSIERRASQESPKITSTTTKETIRFTNQLLDTLADRPTRTDEPTKSINENLIKKSSFDKNSEYSKESNQRRIRLGHFFTSSPSKFAKLNDKELKNIYISEDDSVEKNAFVNLTLCRCLSGNDSRKLNKFLINHKQFSKRDKVSLEEYQFNQPAQSTKLVPLLIDYLGNKLGYLPFGLRAKREIFKFKNLTFDNHSVHSLAIQNDVLSNTSEHVNNDLDIEELEDVNQISNDPNNFVHLNNDFNQQPDRQTSSNNDRTYNSNNNQTDNLKNANFQRELIAHLGQPSFDRFIEKNMQTFNTGRTVFKVGEEESSGQGNPGAIVLLKRENNCTTYLRAAYYAVCDGENYTAVPKVEKAEFIEIL